MNFHSSAAAFLAAFLLCPTANAKPAEAATPEPIGKAAINMILDVMPVAKEVRKYADIKVLDCKEPDYNAFFVHGRFPAIEICADNIEDVGELQHAVSHEAMHLAQWCHGADNIYSPSAHEKFAKEDDWMDDYAYAHKRASRYDAEDYDSELEAYFYTRGLDQDVIMFLDDYCKA